MWGRFKLSGEINLKKYFRLMLRRRGGEIV